MIYINNYLISMWGPYGGMMGGYFGFFSFFGLLTWIALLIFLILGSVFFWKEITKKK